MSEQKHKTLSLNEAQWHAFLQGEAPTQMWARHLVGLIPASPRCKVCNAPFTGIGGVLMRLIGKRQFSKNPNFCTMCLFDQHTHIGGVEIEISMLFADVRGSTGLAEKMSPSAFTQLMNRFYGAATDILVRTDAWIDKLVGDEVIGLYIPGFAGRQHAQRAVRAAYDIIRATGHGTDQGPWLSIGVGVHTGLAYVGLVGAEGGVSDLTALGDAMNVAARLASQAKPGEVLLSEDACQAARLAEEGLEQRQLELKGRSAPIQVRVMDALSAPPRN